MKPTPWVLLEQRERDLEGHGHSLRPLAETNWAECWEDQWSSTKLSRACLQLSVSFDRLLSNEPRCEAYCTAIDAALASGARTFAVLGAGSLLPAMHAAHAGARVVIVEPCAPLAHLARTALAENSLSAVVVSGPEMLRKAWGEMPDVLLTERIDEGLLPEGIVPQLRAAVCALGACAPKHVIPRAASVSAVACQLGFEGVDGFGFDGLQLDLSCFDALRPRGMFARQWPGYWPVRLLPARQPHRRLSAPFAVTTIDFAEVCEAAARAGKVDNGEAYREYNRAARNGTGGDSSSAALEVVATADGWLNAIVFWFELQVGPGGEGRVSSAPPEVAGRRGAAGTWSEGWRQAACYLEQPRHVRAGEVLRLRQTTDLARGFHFELYEDVISHPISPTAINALHGALPFATTPKLHAGAQVPINAYHFCMVADTVRNEAYRAAIERVVGRRPGCRVLDIGAGTGLLGVMCARAGAGTVDLVEMNDTLADVAERTLCASGVHGAKVWHTISTELSLDPARKLGPAAPADVIVSEILDSACIGEGVLHTMRDATRRLLSPGGSLVPHAATIHVMAVQLHTPEVGPFSFDCLGRLRNVSSYSSARLHTLGHTRLSAPASAMHLDFYQPGPMAADGTAEDRQVRVRLPVLRRGTCNAIVYWFDLHLDEQTVLSAGPGSPVRTWKQNFANLSTPCVVAKGDVIEAVVRTSADNQIDVSGGPPGVDAPLRAQGTRVERNFG